MWLDALLAYLHFTAIFFLFALLTTELVLFRGTLDARVIRLLEKVDRFYFLSAMLVLGTGLLRMFFGAKGAGFYVSSWPFYAKIALFTAVAIISIKPTRAFVQWRRAVDGDPGWQVPEDERQRIRGNLLLQVHVAAMIPVFAVVMARGLGY